MTNKRKAVSPVKAATSGETTSTKHYDYSSKNSFNQHVSDNSSTSQRAKILHYLKNTGPLTTLQARHILDIMHPGMRVFELRQIGHPIETVWTEDITPEGNLHRVGQYILLPSKQLPLPGFDLEDKGSINTCCPGGV